MQSTGLFIDANLLVLFVVGSVRRDLITRHRRLQKFGEQDYDLLLDVIDPVTRVYVTPNTLTETSNLLAQHREPERSRFFDRLRYIIQESEEVVVASTAAAERPEFRRLGLTDAALLDAVTADTPLLTVDLALYLAGLDKHPSAAVNFTHLQNL